MIPYSFSVLRYVHDGVTSEFVNIGIAVYSGDASFLKAKCTIQYGRITRMFDRIDGERFKQLVRYVEDGIVKLGSNLKQQTLSFAPLGTTIESLLREILPEDDSAIQFSPPSYGVSLDLEETLRQLFERYVERYAGQADIPSRSDDEVWRTFKTALEAKGLLPYLHTKRITAPDYDYEFKTAWKNGVWHVYEPVSFDLVEGASILDKANRWLGRAANLAESEEPFHLHLLIGAPQEARLKPVFARAQNILKKMSGASDVVLEEEADAFASDLEREIALYLGNTGKYLFK